MKQIGIIKWILSLKESDRLMAMILICVSVLWSQGLWDKHAYNKLQDAYRIELLRRTDSCEAQKIRLIENSLTRSEKTQVLVDSLVKANLFIINTNNKNINIVKKHK